MQAAAVVVEFRDFRIGQYAIPDANLVNESIPAVKRRFERAAPNSELGRIVEYAACMILRDGSTRIDTDADLTESGVVAATKEIPRRCRNGSIPHCARDFPSC
jgi:hypothetical protein